MRAGLSIALPGARELNGFALEETVKDIISAGSLICQWIAAHSPALGAVKDGAQQLIQFATGQSTQRSQMDAPRLTERLRQRGIEQSSQAETDEVWLIIDPSDLRKPYAQEMEALTEVQDLNGDLAPGYRTLQACSLLPGPSCGRIYRR